MKKQTRKLNPSASSGLRLHKRTISNLNTPELTKIVGGGTGPTRRGLGCTGNTCHGGTCGNGHTCYC